MTVIISFNGILCAWVFRKLGTSKGAGNFSILNFTVNSSLLPI
jgi:hypothetical protein